MGADRTPLSALARTLTGVALPRPSVLVSILGEAQGYPDFYHLVDEYLPEHRTEVLGVGNSADMVAAFAQRFEDRYFPLASTLRDGDVESLEGLTGWLVPQVFGLDYDDLHELTDDRLGRILASFLVDFEAQASPPDTGIRITLLEKAAESVPGDWLSRLASQGFPLEDFKVLEGTDYEGALWHARYLLSATENMFCDATEDEIAGMTWPWSRDTVDSLSEEWADARAIQDRMVHFYEWLEQAPEEHCRLVYRRLRGIPDVPEQQLPLGLAFGD